jgi:hypothetical protein
MEKREILVEFRENSGINPVLGLSGVDDRFVFKRKKRNTT